MGAVAWITGILLTLGFLASGGMKLTKQAMAVQVADRLHYKNLMQPIGVAEVVGAIGVFIGLLSDGKGLEWLGLLGGLGLLATMIGAVFYHQKAGDPPKEMAPAIVLALLSILYLIAIMAR
jgi:DoxX-like family